MVRNMLFFNMMKTVSAAFLGLTVVGVSVQAGVPAIPGLPTPQPAVPGVVPGLPAVPAPQPAVPGQPGVNPALPGIPGGLPTLPGQGGGVQPPVVGGGQPVGGTPGVGVPTTPAVPQVPAILQQPMTPALALSILQNRGFMARRYHAGVPDPIRVQRVDNRTRMRAVLNSKLNNLVIPEINGLDGFTMEEAVEALETAFRTSDPEKTGFQMYINPHVDPGGVPIQNTGGAGGAGGGPAGGGPAGPGGGVGGLDPTTGLPLGGGPAMGGPGGPGGAQGVDPTTGLPLGPAAGGAPPGIGGTGAPGLPGVGGPGAALPGMGGGGAGLPGIGGGGATGGTGGPAAGAFDPTVVKVRGLKKKLVGLSAKQVLDVVCMSFDTPIQYVVTDQGIMFLQQDRELWGTVTRTFQLNLNRRTLQMMGVATPPLTPPPAGGGGQPGGGQPGGGPGGGQPGGGLGGGQPGGGGYPGGGPGGGEMGGPGMGGPGVPGAGTQFRFPNRNTGGFGSGYRPFSNMNRFAPTTSRGFQASPRGFGFSNRQTTRGFGALGARPRR